MALGSGSMVCLSFFSQRLPPSCTVDARRRRVYGRLKQPEKVPCPAFAPVYIPISKCFSLSLDPASMPPGSLERKKKKTPTTVKPFNPPKTTEPKKPNNHNKKETTKNPPPPPSSFAIHIFEPKAI